MFTANFRELVQNTMKVLVNCCLRLFSFVAHRNLKAERRHGTNLNAKNGKMTTGAFSNRDALGAIKLMRNEIESWAWWRIHVRNLGLNVGKKFRKVAQCCTDSCVFHSIRHFFLTSWKSSFLNSLCKLDIPNLNFLLLNEIMMILSGLSWKVFFSVFTKILIPELYLTEHNLENSPLVEKMRFQFYDMRTSPKNPHASLN